MAGTACADPLARTGRVVTKKECTRNQGASVCTVGDRVEPGWTSRRTRTPPTGLERGSTLSILTEQFKNSNKNKINLTRPRGGVYPIPIWLESQGLTEESLRAAVTELGIEILGALCARAEPPPARVQLCSLAAQKFTSTMYAGLCRFMESCLLSQGPQQLESVTSIKETEGRARGPPGDLWKKGEDKDSVGVKEEERDLEDGRQAECIRKFPCSSCSHSFTTTAALQVHKLWHHPVSSAKKYNCPYSTDRKRNYDAHFQSCITKTMYTCDVCGRRFCRLENYKKHSKIHSVVGPYKGKVCTFSDSSTFEKHRRCAKGRPSSYNPTNKGVHTGEHLHTCQVCSKGLHDLSHCKEHVRIYTGERPYTCKVCTKAFSNSSSLKIHTRIHTGEKPFKCDVCGKEFRHSSHHHEHKRIHTRERPYICDVCGKGFTQSATHGKHMRVHTGERPCTCSVCAKGFIKSPHHRCHMRIHSQERKYKCTVCAKAFFHSSSLKMHTRIHTGEKPFKCDCGKEFRQSSHFLQHKQIHTGERPYTCKMCGKGFAQSSNHWKHMQIHKEERRYTCETCGKGFVQSSNHWKHMQIHMRENPYNKRKTRQTKLQMSKRNVKSHQEHR
uniref:C2H2-type domain-containing protein n=2 Tax=Eptatretus burgeri TaxID=7764 RepID=A0A8C4NL44_EPTBU